MGTRSSRYDTGRRLCSEEPNDPPGKPAGFGGRDGLGVGVAESLTIHRAIRWDLEEKWLGRGGSGEPNDPPGNPVGFGGRMVGGVGRSEEPNDPPPKPVGFS